MHSSQLHPLHLPDATHLHSLNALATPAPSRKWRVCRPTGTSEADRGAGWHGASLAPGEVHAVSRENRQVQQLSNEPIPGQSGHLTENITIIEDGRLITNFNAEEFDNAESILICEIISYERSI